MLKSAYSTSPKPSPGPRYVSDTQKAVCRPAVDACDITEYCTGLGQICPLDHFRDCDDHDPCTVDVCDEIAGCLHIVFFLDFAPSPF